VPAHVRPQIHALQLDSAVAQVAERGRPDDVSAVLGDPERDIAGGRVVEVTVELGVQLKPELRQRVGDQRPKALRVARFERDDVD
jgi:hypothetical protein